MTQKPYIVYGKTGESIAECAKAETLQCVWQDKNITVWMTRRKHYKVYGNAKAFGRQGGNITMDMAMQEQYSVYINAEALQCV